MSFFRSSFTSAFSVVAFDRAWEVSHVRTLGQDTPAAPVPFLGDGTFLAQRSRNHIPVSWFRPSLYCRSLRRVGRRSERHDRSLFQSAAFGNSISTSFPYRQWGTSQPILTHRSFSRLAMFVPSHHPGNICTVYTSNSGRFGSTSP